MSLPKWTDERTEALHEAVAGVEMPISYAMVEQLAEGFETSSRSVGAKLRKMGFEVERASDARSKAFTDEQEEALRQLVLDNSGELTYAEIAERFEDGAFTAKSIQGKLLSMELNSHVKPTPEKARPRTYTPEEEILIRDMWTSGAFVEEIAEAVNRKVASVRGKCLSLLKEMPEGTTLPPVRDKKPAAGSLYDQLAEMDLENLTDEDIATELGKTVRGVRSALTKRRLACANYDGAAKAEKAAARSA